MSVKWVTTVLFLMSAELVGCGGAGGPGEFAMTSAARSIVAAKSPVADEMSGAETKSARHVIREGELRFETDDKTATRTAILGFVNEHQGYLADDREQRNSDVLEQTMTIRVPSAEFGGLLEDVSGGVSRFDRREIQAIDVTEEYVDIEARSAGFWIRIRNNFSLGWTVVVEGTIAIVTLWPLILMSLLGSLTVYWYNRKTTVRKVAV